MIYDSWERKSYPAGKWIVVIHGDHKGGEISVCREGFKHGRRSLGWFDQNKILVGGSPHWSVTKEIWHLLKQVAKKHADSLNKKEKK